MATPNWTPDSPFPDPRNEHRVGNFIWVPLRDRWVDVTHKPEEVVRQEWIHRLHEGGYALEQMDQERRTAHGRQSPRADIVVWRSGTDKVDKREPVVVVETKAEEGPVREADFWQGQSYAYASGARFLVLANKANHSVFETQRGFPVKARQINDWPTAETLADEKALDALVNRLEVFDREQFQRVLFECHSLLRDNHAMTPDRAFDTISKTLFIKLHIERTQTHETFTTKYLDGAKKYFNDPKKTVHDQLFDQTKSFYAADELFTDEDRLEVSTDTFYSLVSKLERFNLSKTGDDVKGIAFEKFLGRTFRGELGQFFTPRPVVDFMVKMLDPKEGEIICDPAAGSGGFLIHVFDHVRDQIAYDLALQREDAKNAIMVEYAENASEADLEERDQRIDEAVADINRQLMTSDPQSGGPVETRVGRLAWHCIFGTDKEPRAARTAKMNMIMHGDGHGGIHWHDGLIDVNGVFGERFDVVITNPPFGSVVNNGQRIGSTPETDVPNDKEYVERQKKRYGKPWRAAHQAVISARGKPILEQYEIGHDTKSRKTEQLFLERCLRLLAPGGRLAIVLPNGNLNAASQAWLRRWAEGKAFLRAVVALPTETFKFSGASVTASVVFMQKFTEEESERWEQCWADALTETEATFDPLRQAAVKQAMSGVIDAGDRTLVKILGELEKVGTTRVLPGLTRTPLKKGTLVKGAPKTTVKGPVWKGTSGNKANELRKSFATRAAKIPALKTNLTALRDELKTFDEQQSQAMWKYVREAFDYRVFMATPQAVGITATGDTGPGVPDDLPEILASWKQFANEQLGGKRA